MTTETTTETTARRARIVNFGGGVDSTAILVGLVALYRLGVVDAKPDLVLFADTGAERPETMAHIEMMSAWLVAQGFPAVTFSSRPLHIKMVSPLKTITADKVIAGLIPVAGELSFQFSGSFAVHFGYPSVNRFLFTLTI